MSQTGQCSTGLDRHPPADQPGSPPSISACTVLAVVLEMHARSRYVEMQQSEHEPWQSHDVGTPAVGTYIVYLVTNAMGMAHLQARLNGSSWFLPWVVMTPLGASRQCSAEQSRDRRTRRLGEEDVTPAGPYRPN